MGEPLLFLGVDGGGTRCRARLADAAGAILGEGLAGPANIRIGLDESLRSVLDAAGQCLAQAGATRDTTVAACLALAGASEPREAAAARAACAGRFHRVRIVTDAEAACVGAHRGEDGGVIVVGTGSIGWAVCGGRSVRVGGWGFPVSDEGGGAWLGCEAVRRTLRAHDGRTAWTPLLRRVSAEFGSDPHAIVRWMGPAKPRDFARLAPLVLDHAALPDHQDPAAAEIMRLAAGHIDAIASRLAGHGAARLALMGGLAAAIEPWLGPATRARLVPPAGDALDGALHLARNAACVIPEIRGSGLSGTQHHEASAAHLALGPGSRAGARGRDDKGSVR
ncbi:MAG TPA: BadF/BadG/BcrA/BcrD ATPase family protein [Hyphomicrobiaceae bacterium]